ncbi:outer membrane lipoprotein-sorting protein [Thiomicrorhabdus lithotrophica]|uniref:Outer membrane lipoprotein-sorting protein n=1 Tax=Thiomicrorhabdus lithotrophica TaxID=2949997 RepID=A0ABY8C9E1_9GAMM|nr:outer membrane lipoprotein-sorting protein [Thiomicrorhabdus lithotrophica]WEJ62589.1 outer membrane lipoprotein-sorting protein [Thiomicrorhabdus lithotrophica]
MNSFKKQLLYFVTASLVILSNQAWSEASKTHDVNATQLLKEVDARLQPSSYEMYRKLINIEPDGDRKEFVLYTVKKGKENVVALFLDPASERGRSSLRVGDNMWLYIPNVGKPLRITSLQSVVGGVFNNSDILQLDYSTEYNAQNVTEEGEQLLLSLKAKNRSVAYDQLKMWVDKTHKTPIKIEAYSASGMLIKTLHYSKIKDFGNGYIRPAMLETDSPLYKGFKSVMLFDGIKPREFSEEVFSLGYMSKIGELRE